MNHADILNVLILAGLGYVVKLLWDLKETSKSNSTVARNGGAGEETQRNGGAGEER